MSDNAEWFVFILYWDHKDIKAFSQLLREEIKLYLCDNLFILFKSVLTYLMLHKSFSGPLSFDFPICFASGQCASICECFHCSFVMSVTKGAASLCYILTFVIWLWVVVVNSVESCCMPQCLSKNLLYKWVISLLFWQFKMSFTCT